MNKNYLKYLFSSKRILVGFIAIVEIVMTCLIRLLTDVTQGFSWFACMWLDAIGSYILCFVLPIYLNKYLHSKKMADTYFGLPITRKELLTSNYIFEFVTIIAPLVITTIISCMLPAEFNITPLVVLLIVLVEILIVAMLLALNTLIVMLTNSTLDALIIGLAYHVLPFIVIITITCILDAYVVGFTTFSISDYMWLSPDAKIFSVFEAALESTNNEFFTSSNIFNIVYLAVLGMASFIGSYALFDRRKAENAEEKSSALFAYPLIRHIYVALLLLVVSVSFYGSSNYAEVIIFDIIIFVLYIISGFVYERKLAIRKYNVVFALATVACALLISFIGYQTRGFGLSYRFNRNIDSLTLEYRLYQEEDIETITNAIGLNGYSYVYNIEVNVKVDHADEELKKAIFDLQNKAVDQYYKEKLEYDYHSGYLQVIENERTRNERRYSYNPIGELDLNTIRVLAKYGKVTLSGYSNDTGSLDLDITKYLR